MVPDLPNPNIQSFYPIEKIESDFSQMTRGNGHKLEHRKFQLEMRNNLSKIRVVKVRIRGPDRLWNICPCRHPKLT